MKKAQYTLTHSGYNEWYTDMMIACGGMGKVSTKGNKTYIDYEGTTIGYWDDEAGDGYSVD